jgi:uncharacterized protein YndB with AHSA1/START domain
MHPTGSKPKLELTTPSDREIVMARAFDKPRTLVFEAFTKPEHLQRWLLGPDGWSMPICEVDLRPGGAFRYVWRNDADGREFGLLGTYRELVPPERIVHVERFDDPAMPGDAQVTTTFVERGSTTTVTMTILYESKDVRDMALESGMDRGVSASFDRLAGILE